MVQGDLGCSTRDNACALFARCALIRERFARVWCAFIRNGSLASDTTSPLLGMMDSENDEEGVVPYKAKYRQLKNRLKYLIYVSVTVFQIRLHGLFSPCGRTGARVFRKRHPKGSNEATPTLQRQEVGSVGRIISPCCENLSHSSLSSSPVFCWTS